MIAPARFLFLLLALFAGPLLLPAPVRAQADGFVTYEVKRGDTLYGLSRLYMIRDADALRVQRVNRIANPRRIPVGKRLNIPREVLRYVNVELRVAGFSGPVSMAGGAPAVGTVLGEGEIVTTGRAGFVSFRATGGGEVSLPSNTRARLLRARRYVLGDLLDIDFAILAGRGETRVPSLREGERFRLRTPAAVTAVRGTEFRVAHDEGTERSLTEVVEGEVAVVAGSEQAIAAAGFGVASVAGDVGEAEALLPPPAMLDPGAVQTGETLQFAIAPVAGTSGFRTQIARDAGFLDVIDEQTGGDGTVTFPGLANGRYFVRSRSIATSGLEGLSEAHAFRRKRLGIAAEAAPAPLADGFLFKWLAQQEQGDTSETFFALQIWREGQAASPVVDETGLRQTALVVTSLEPGVYLWRVAAIQAVPEGLLKVWSPSQKLTVSE